jgi:hypothetical protein
MLKHSSLPRLKPVSISEEQQHVDLVLEQIQKYEKRLQRNQVKKSNKPLLVQIWYLSLVDLVVVLVPVQLR